MKHLAGDGELWRRSQEGDAQAFGLLFDRYANPIYAYCFRRTADWSLAEDLTSVVFLEAWRRRSEVTQVDQTVGPWLYGVASNVLRNQRRSLRRYQAALKRLPALEPESDFADDVVERVQQAQRMHEVLAVLRLLPKAEQDAFTLCDWQGLSVREAADALRVPEPTIRTRLFRARRRFRESLYSAPVQQNDVVPKEG